MEIGLVMIRFVVQVIVSAAALWIAIRLVREQGSYLLLLTNTALMAVAVQGRAITARFARDIITV